MSSIQKTNSTPPSTTSSSHNYEGVVRAAVSFTGARIAAVDENSPAYEMGFEPGCSIIAVNSQPVHDILDWRWLSADDEMTVTYVDTDGDAGTIHMTRDSEEAWGFAFEGDIFDEVRTCRNACTFCFMRQLPKHMRASLCLRDDDFRLSFLSGTFVTLTNLDDADIARILEQRLSPLRVSLHATDPDIRRTIIGKHADVGLRNLETLLDGGIEIDAQIVLIPHVNDGEILCRTLTWAYAHKGIKTIGIVPLGFTSHQQSFKEGFDDPQSAQTILDTITPFQTQALIERGTPWVFAADEFYIEAYGEEVIEKLPPMSFYGDLSMFEDGIGILRCCLDEMTEAEQSGLSARCASVLSNAHLHLHYVCGYAMAPYFPTLLSSSALVNTVSALPIQNRFFGGNVDVTGLLCAADIIPAITECSRHLPEDDIHHVFVVPDVIFNTDGITLDGSTLEDLRHRSGIEIRVVPSNPLDYILEFIEIAKDIQHGSSACCSSRTPKCG